MSILQDINYCVKLLTVLIKLIKVVNYLMKNFDKIITKLYNVVQNT